MVKGIHYRVTIVVAVLVVVVAVVGHKASGVKPPGGAAAHAFSLLKVPSIFGGWLSGKGGDDDESDLSAPPEHQIRASQHQPHRQYSTSQKRCRETEGRGLSPLSLTQRPLPDLRQSTFLPKSHRQLY